MCNCNKKLGTRYKVVLPGGLTITKSSKEAADTYAAKHPGSTVKPA